MKLLTRVHKGHKSCCLTTFFQVLASPAKAAAAAAVTSGQPCFKHRACLRHRWNFHAALFPRGFLAWPARSVWDSPWILSFARLSLPVFLALVIFPLSREWRQEGMQVRHDSIRPNPMTARSGDRRDGVLGTRWRMGDSNRMGERGGKRRSYGHPSRALLYHTHTAR
ncbi:hypothetical protein B0H63DRAFT_289844 [Podospora didyma]|uniref:Uncharacterized protein n=1 Tax=Podospora didyma TaxID=330526 RepID=A0AAE0K9M5_9PEZI|nr:hypothetical protein B0H63DRAFT_289844 [Podospora didyma]